MSGEKPETDAAAERPIKVIVERRADPTANRSARVEVVSLAIDEDFDLGCDPYNRTGQFMALKQRDGGSE